MKQILIKTNFGVSFFLFFESKTLIKEIIEKSVQHLLEIEIPILNIDKKQLYYKETLLDPNMDLDSYSIESYLPLFLVFDDDQNYNKSEFNFEIKKSFLSKPQCKIFINFIDKCCNDKIQDQKILIQKYHFIELLKLVQKENYDLIINYLFSFYKSNSKILLRKITGKFHFDHLDLIKINLNDNYQGGKICYIPNKSVKTFLPKTGTLIKHNNKFPYKIFDIENGTKYEIIIVDEIYTFNRDDIITLTEEIYEKVISQIQNTEENKINNCSICYSQKSNIVMVPCGHCCVCKICCDSANFRVCPVCRCEIEKTVKVYFC